MPTVGPVMVAADPQMRRRQAAVPASLAARLGLSAGELLLTAGLGPQAAAAAVVAPRSSR